MKNVFLTLFVILCVGVGKAQPVSNNDGKSMITLAQLEHMFVQIRTKSGWNMDGEMLWGYFFLDPDEKKLEALAKHLAGDGYRMVEIRTNPGDQTHTLHVERVEIHSPQTLDVRDREFYLLADQYGIASYDGMDVGPVPAVPTHK